MMSPLIWLPAGSICSTTVGVVGLDAYLSLQWVAFFHTLGAFMILIFFIAHVYRHRGHTPTSHIKAMITGWEEGTKTLGIHKPAPGDARRLWLSPCGGPHPARCGHAA